MTQITEFFTAYLGPQGLLIILVVIGFMMLLTTLPLILRKREDPMDRISKIQARAPEEERLTTSQSDTMFDAFAQYLEPDDKEGMSEVRAQLIRAGYYSRSAVRVYNGYKFIFAIGGFLCGFIYMLLSEQSFEENALSYLLIVFFPGLVGYYFPVYWLKRREQARIDEMEQGFPDALDLLLICVEAGQSLDQAIQRTALEMLKQYPVLSEEFTIVSNELQAGKERAEVLRDMAERVQNNDIKSFTAVMIQSAAFGTPVSDALRVYASEMRDKRFMRAEEKANLLPTKMVLATIGLTVPPLIVILVGPSVYELAVFFQGAEISGSTTGLGGG